MQFYDRRILSYLQKIIVTITPMEIAVDTIWRINVLIVLGSFQFTFEYGAPKNIILSNSFHYHYYYSIFHLAQAPPCQDAEAKAQTSKDHAEGKPSSETLNEAKVKARDALTLTTFSFNT
jgi:hypothetical protein